jgi:hypothetical protein
VRVAIKALHVVDIINVQQFGEMRFYTEKDIVIAVGIGNLSQNRKIDYRGWGKIHSLLQDTATLTDNFGNEYKFRSFPVTTKPFHNFGGELGLVPQVESSSIHPGVMLVDLLVFEEPLENIDYLRLQLAASNFQGDGHLRFQIPRSMIRWRGANDEPPPKKEPPPTELPPELRPKQPQRPRLPGELPPVPLPGDKGNGPWLPRPGG